MTFAAQAEKFNGNPVVIAEVALDSGSVYYAATDVDADIPAEGYVKSFGSLTRSAAHPGQGLTMGEISISFTNTDNTFSKWDDRKLLGREVTLTLYFSATEYQTLFSGVISGYEYNDQTFILQAKDWSDHYFTDTYLPTLKIADWPNLKSSLAGAVMPLYYGALSYDSGAVTGYLIDSDAGKYLLAGHALKAVTAVYKNGSALNAGQYEVDLAEVFTSGIGGYIATVTVPSASSADLIAADVEGVESAGDGSGTLYTNPVDILDHFLKTVLGLPAGKVSTATAKTVAAARGYVFAGGIIAKKGASEVVKEIIEAMAGTCHFSAEGVFTAMLFEPEFQSDLPEYSEQDDITDWRLEFGQDGLTNKINVKYNYIPSEGACLADVTVENTISQANLNRVYETERELKWAADAATAIDAARRILIRLQYPLAIASFTTALRALNLDLAQAAALTHRTGAGTASGEYAARAFEVKEITLKPDKYRVEMKLVDLESWSSLARFWLGDREIQAGSWPGAGEADAKFGYLCDRATGEFSNGDEGKCLY